MACWTQEFMRSLDGPHLWDKCETLVERENTMAMPECSNHQGDELCTKADSNGIHRAERSTSVQTHKKLTGTITYTAADWFGLQGLISAVLALWQAEPISAHINITCLEGWLQNAYFEKVINIADWLTPKATLIRQLLEIHSHKQQDGSTICLSSSQTCSTVRMRTGLHSQTHARTDSFDQVNELCEQSSMHRPQHQQRPYSLLNLSPLETRLKLKLLVHTFRCIHNKASSLLYAQYQVRSPTHSTQRTTRAQTYTSLIIPRVSKSAGAKSPAFFSTLLWNELPSDLRSLSSVHSFRQKLMVYLDSL